MRNEEVVVEGVHALLELGKIIDRCDATMEEIRSVKMSAASHVRYLTQALRDLVNDYQQMKMEQ